MTWPITIEKIELGGFRAYLQPQTFDLRSGKRPCSMAVFAPNGMGKSSLVDSFEYYLSKEQTLSRLGKKADTHAGPAAMKNVDAEAGGITPTVHFWFRQGSYRFGDPRKVPGPPPEAAEVVNSRILVLPIIRGYELRRFVDDDTPGDRYKELARWFSLDPLRKIQDNLRSLKRAVKERAESTAEERERARDLKDLTGNKFSDWDEDGIRDWFNADILSNLDRSFRIRHFSESSAEFQNLKSRARKERERAGIEQLRNAADKIEELLAADEPAGGKIAEFERAVRERNEADEYKERTRREASSAIFKEVWESAQKLFEEEADLDACPVCGTQLSESPSRSHAGVCGSLRRQISQLADYRTAVGDLKKATTKMSAEREGLSGMLGDLRALLDAAGHKCAGAADYLGAIKAWDAGGDPPDSARAVSSLNSVLSSVRDGILQIKKRQGERTYDQALETGRGLIQAKASLEGIRRTKKSLADLKDGIALQTRTVDGAIRDLIQGRITELQDLTNAIYGEIQGDGADAPPIRLVPKEGGTEQRRVDLLVDFKDLSGVVPSGYLSDSQLHTLALALRLSAVQMLNSAFPVLVLDDVVTSYDVERRTNIAKVLAERFDGFQIVVVTHDEQFFKILRDRLPAGCWKFRRIREIRQGFGPIFEDHLTQDKVIDGKLSRGESAAVEIRMAEEEWLNTICTDFRTKVDKLRTGNANGRSELAESLARFLRGRGIKPPKVAGMKNDFFVSMQRGVVENSGSHFSDSRHSSRSISDEVERWKEFKHFRDMFACKCGSRRFTRPRGVNKPLCRKCQAVFVIAAKD